MKLGIFVNTGRHIDAVTGITQAAVKKGTALPSLQWMPAQGYS